MLALVLALLPDQPFVESVLRLRVPDSRVAVTDVDADGLMDLLVLSVAGAALHAQRADGSFPADADALLPWPSTGMAWDLADADGDGDEELVMLDGGARLLLAEAGSTATGPRWSAMRELAAGLAGALPAGIRRANLVHDVDGNGRPDVVVPAGNGYLVLVADDAGGYRPPLRVQSKAVIEIEVGDPDSLNTRFGQDVRMPDFELRDVDGDDLIDLSSESETELAVFLASPEESGSRLPESPSWTLDLDALRGETRAEAPRTIDLDDLLAMAQPEVAWHVADVDGSPPHDMVLQQGGRFRIYRGGARGPDLARPDQVLKASGNVLYFQLRDVDGDGLSDLQLVRAEKVSLGRVLRWLVMTGALDFDVFTYRALGGAAGGEAGEVVARKPSSRRTLSLRIPALLGFIDEMEEMGEEFERRQKVPARALCLGGDGRSNDVVDVREASLVLVADVGPDEPLRSLVEDAAGLGDIDAIVERYVLQDLDRLDDGGSKVIDLADMDQLLESPGAELRDMAAGKEPVATWPLAFPVQDVVGSEDDTPVTLRVHDLDGDGVSDVIAVGHDEQGLPVLQVLVTRVR